MAAELVTKENYEELFEHFTKNSYQAKKVDAISASIQEKCEKLFAKDYRFSIVNNTNGELCNTYPSRIIFLEGEKGSASDENSEKPDDENNNINDAARYRERVLRARVARCRTRFPVPVILVDGKFICRSSTLACGKEIYPRMSYDYLFLDEPTDTDRENRNMVDEYEEIDDSPPPLEPSEIDQDLNDEESIVGECRTYDVQLLRDLSITNICDLMMEDRKVKLAMYVTSSEKADKRNRYKEFNILSMPYPGCEFFQKFREHDYHGEKMRFDWMQSYIKRKLQLPRDFLTTLDVDWERYKEWDLNTLTQNYMKVLIKCISEGTSNLLIHCISGWDRTPLFISMLRLSLWADGKIHQSLTPLEMLYLTVGYDWFLFGHQLSCRISKREEIMNYCFHFLKHLPSLNKEISNGERRANSPLEPDENLESITAHSNNVNPSYGGIDVLKNPDALWSTIPEDYVIEQTSPQKIHPTSTLAEKNEMLLSSVDSSEDLSSIRCNTPTNSDGREDATSFSVSPPDLQSTSPLAVPSGSRRRTESSSSDVSYLFISDTGSIPPSSREFSLRSENCRKEKLDEVRRMFSKKYFTFMDFRFKSGSGSGIMGLINQYAEKVGIRTPKPPS